MVARSALPLLAAFGLFAAGCLSGPVPHEESSASPGLGAAPFQDPSERNTAAAPVWQTGEWWTYRVTDNVGRVYEGTRVVAGVDDDTYVVGFPIEEWPEFGARIIGFHFPAMGDVQASDMAFEVHDEVYKALDFPLTAGKSWTSSFEGQAMTFTVEEVTEKAARITGARIYNDAAQEASQTALGLGFATTGEYEAELGEFRRLTIDVYGTLEILDHGFGWEGTIRAPRNQSMPLHTQRIAGVGPALALTPTEDIEVLRGPDGMSLVLGAGSLYNGDVYGPGLYRITAIHPDGTPYMVEAGPMERLTFSHFEVGPPAGTWHVEFLTAGPGAVTAEGFAYEVHDIDIPSLEVRRPATV